MPARRAKTAGSVLLDDALLRRWPLPQPGSDGDKEDRGRVLVIGGSREMPGAVILAATAALRAGAGKLTIATAARVAPAVAMAVCEARVIGLAESGNGSYASSSVRLLPDDASAVLIGPGMEADRRNRAFVAAVLERSCGGKIVLDAGAMDVIVALPQHVIAARALFAKRAGSSLPPLLLTPHAGELAHLLGVDKDWILGHPEEAARDAARRWDAIVTLKGAITFIAAPDGRLWRHQGGNIGLATSGSGDVLSGLIAGIAARGAPIEQASAWGISLHAHAGAALAARVGTLGYLAREIAGEVPAVMQALRRKSGRY